jgi:Na+-translocating ferredoxin:NAD+ oxidoreductase RnfE subunit
MGRSPSPYFDEEKHMSRVALSGLVYGIYLYILGLTLFTVPDFAVKLFGLEPHKDVWLYVTAMTVVVLATYFVVAARSESISFLRASVPLRFLVPVFFAVFAALNLTKFNILLLTPPDVIFASWTLFALRAEQQGKGAAQA